MPRENTVAVAVIYDRNSDSYLLWNNKRWRGYAFPMKKFKPGKGTDPCKVAKAAIDELDCPLNLSNVAADQIDLQHHLERSASHGDVASYEYHVCAIDPEPSIRTLVGDPDVRWFPYAELKKARSVTASTKQIVKTLVKERNVAVAVISRPSRRGREFLLVWKGDRYKYFFPCTRMVQEKKPGKAAIRAIQNDAAYGGTAKVAAQAEVEAVQSSFRFGPHLGRFKFHPCLIALPASVDLSANGNALETALNGKQAMLAKRKSLPPSGRYWGWFTEQELRKGKGMSESMKKVLLTVLQLVENNS